MITSIHNLRPKLFSDGKHIMFEKSILQDIAEQNFLKYEVNYKSPNPVIVSRENTRMVVCLLLKSNLINIIFLMILKVWVFSDRSDLICR